MEGKVGTSNLGIVQGSAVFTKQTIMFHMLDLHMYTQQKLAREESLGKNNSINMSIYHFIDEETEVQAAQTIHPKLKTRQDNTITTVL